MKISPGRYRAKRDVTIDYGVESGHFGGGGTVTLTKGMVIHVSKAVEGADDISIMMRNLEGIKHLSRDLDVIHRNPGVAWFEMTEEQFRDSFDRPLWG